jgi:hypothetical protein
MQVGIGIKYCGGCNSIIDRAKLAREIGKALPPEYSLSTELSSNPWDIGIMVCGCLTSCADKPDVKNLARQWIFVSGNSVDLKNMPEEKMADVIVKKIFAWKK